MLNIEAVSSGDAIGFGVFGREVSSLSKAQLTTPLGRHGALGHLMPIFR